MTYTIIITICSLLIIAYLFDLSSSRTKIPSVIIFLILGWVVRQVSEFVGFEFYDYSLVLTILGTIGLVLIVLEGSFELELSMSKVGIMSKSLLGALIPMFIIIFLLTKYFMYHGYSISDSMLNAIPFSVISSAIAIPSVKHFHKPHKEFIIYESSLSDIIGVLLFNYIALNVAFDTYSIINFSFQFVFIIIISLVTSFGLLLFLKRIDHHIKFIPIILIVILIYALTKSIHLPSLIFILLFGLFLGNLQILEKFKWLKRFVPEDLSFEVIKFKEITVEFSFLIRALFFLLFGYIIESSDIINPDTIILALGIVSVIFIIRFIQLKISRLPLFPLLFLAPRGLITILLFLSIESSRKIPIANKSLIIQVILLMAISMTVGLMKTKKVLAESNERIEKQPEKPEEYEN